MTNKLKDTLIHRDQIDSLSSEVNAWLIHIMKKIEKLNCHTYGRYIDPRSADFLISHPAVKLIGVNNQHSIVNFKLQLRRDSFGLFGKTLYHTHYYSWGLDGNGNYDASFIEYVELIDKLKRINANLDLDLSKINDGVIEDASDLLNQMDINAYNKFRTSLSQLDDLLKEIQQKYPKARYVVDNNSFNLLLGEYDPNGPDLVAAEYSMIDLFAIKD